MPTDTPGRLTVLQLLPALHGGGVERGTLEIAAALVAAGHRSLVVSAGGAMVAELVAGGSEHFELAIGRKSPWVMRTARPLANIITTENVDVVHARSRLPAWVAWKALRQVPSRPAFITTLHGLNSVSRYSAVMTRGDAVIAVSQVCRDYWLSHYPKLEPSRVRLIHRGIDPDAWPYGWRPEPTRARALRRELGVPEGAALVCLPGRISRGKGHADLIDALLDVPSMHAVFPGEGSPRVRARLDALVRRHGVEGRCHFPGHRRDLREIMALSCAVAVLSTKPESFGRTAAEALALGVPVLGYDHGGVGEVLRAIYPSGLVPPGARDALVASLRECEEGRATRVPDFQPFTLANMCKQTLDLYTELTR